jgi:hypothetical protein
LEKLKIIIGGFIGLYPTGGVTWDYLQYPLGLQLLGHDVYYIEDTMQYSQYQTQGQEWTDATESIAYLKRTMDRFGLADKWAYHDVGTGKYYGLSQQKVDELCSTADIFLNISASSFLRDEYYKIPNRILIDSDPMFTQVQDWDDNNPEVSWKERKRGYSWYNHLFTFGENINQPDCKIPTYDLKWTTTRQPICMDHWSNIEKPSKGKPVFSTVMNWATRKNLVYKQEQWGQKNVEFTKFHDIPARCPDVDFEIVMAVSKDLKKEIQRVTIADYGWKILNPADTIPSAEDYKNFISNSTAEFSVAKNGYVKSNSGWFSCRSACYLASGRPVITQETGWSKYIETGEGLFSFNDMESAVRAVKEISSNPFVHSTAAREICHEYFHSSKVLKNMLDAVN